MEVMHESFKIDFDGAAVERHEMHIGAVAEALIAFKSLAEQTNKIANGRTVDLDMRVRGGFHAGSFEIELVLEYMQQSAAAVLPIVSGSCGSVLSSVVNTVQLYRWAKGKDVEIVKPGEQESFIQNTMGERNTFNNCTINLFANKGIKNSVDRLTSVLDDEGFDKILIGNKSLQETITKDDRRYMKIESGTVISDNTAQVQLEVITSSNNGSAKNWRFYEGDGGLEFSATIEDETFLQDVKHHKYRVGSGDCLFVTLRTVQRRQTQRATTERTILEVIDFIPYES